MFYRCAGATRSVWVRFRPFRPGEDERIQDCLRDEYGETYDDRRYYQDGWFTAQAGAGTMEIRLVETDGGEVVGFYLTKCQPYFPGQLELGTLVLRRAVRGCHITGPLFDGWLARMDQMDIQSYFGHMQVFHTRVASELYAHGMIPCGFLLSMLISEQLQHSFGRPRTPKLPFAVALKAVRAKDAGILYVPARHHAFARRVYDGLGVAYQLEATAVAPRRALSALRVYEYEGQDTLWSIVDRIGMDLFNQIRSELDCRRTAPLLTANVLLNARDPSAVWACGQLECLGFFTGFQPLAEGADYLIVHLPGRVPTVFEDFAPFPPWGPLLAHIQSGYDAWRQKAGDVSCTADGFGAETPHDDRSS